MKRSEMLEVMIKAYDSNKAGDEFMSEWMADKILTAMEKAGMLPPEREVVVKAKASTWWYIGCEWESEDENP